MFENYCEEHEINYYNDECPHCLIEEMDNQQSEYYQKLIDDWELHFDGGL